MDLYDFQVDSVKFLSALHGALLADMPRVGKTLPAVKAADKIRAKLIGIVCPAAVIANWQAIIEENSDGHYVAIIFSYNKAGVVRKRLQGWRFDLLIIDESHYCKNRDAGRTQEVYGPKIDGIDGLSGMADRVWALTGTPQPNHPGELWTFLHACAPHIIMRPNGKPMPRSVFVQKYCTVINNGFGTVIRGSKNAKELKEKIKPIMLRRTRLQAFGVDLRPPTMNYVGIPAEYRKELKAMEESPQGKKILAALRQGGLKALKKSSESVPELRRLTGLAKVPGTVALAKQELDGDMKKLVLGCFHTEVIQELYKQLAEFKPVIIDGHVSKERKEINRKRFMTDPKCRVIIGQISAAGVGIDMSAADDVWIVEPDYVGDNNDQFFARVFNSEKRFQPCFPAFMVLAGSMDVDVIRAATKKSKDSDKIFSRT